MSFRGFSLIELMVVVAVIGLLASIAVPVYQDYKTKAVISKYLNLSQHLVTLQKEYFEKHGRFGWSYELVPSAVGVPGCSGCVQLYLLGDDAADDLLQVYVGQGNYPANASCDYNGSVDLRFNNTLTGTSFWVYGRIVYINGHYQYLCMNDTLGNSFLPQCDGSWSNLFAINASIGC